MTEAIRTGLGDFLRSRRERLTPEAVGLPPGRRRRTPGLRREEVAELADIGVDWYVRLEQGRTVTPSATTVDALARALRLDEAEKAHLRALARNVARRGFERETVPPTTRRLVESLDRPAYLTGRRWDVLAWNTAAAELITDFGSRAEEDRNILVYLLLDPAARRRFAEGWEGQAKHVVAQFRAMYDLWALDPAFVDLADRLRRGCPEFETWWDQHDVLGGGAGRKSLHDPVRGVTAYDYATFQANEDPALKLTIYTPVVDVPRTR
ncbi:helix-turn-helix transcriptional regulator [Umezawaea tangerina]|uniref:Xre family transcriptional regulator n=1 Tax=Umezawaea tangerina TaxID=84725 RepID=A0A2T0TI11_9PSEU|nr:helix-turn-helix transcriptional regulator [Umezawaea tangerina]PRY45245.1 Xre family transcriptional regulator [Umezawaea tangerina]